eukprot:COSAG01_NODE_30967_length_606_cov_0.966469_1_plen_105_part_10
MPCTPQFTESATQRLTNMHCPVLSSHTSERVVVTKPGPLTVTTPACGLAQLAVASVPSHGNGCARPSSLSTSCDALTVRLPPDATDIVLPPVTESAARESEPCTL